MSEEQLIPVFIPALIALLVHAEDSKGEPLTHAEVLNIRDYANVMMMEKPHADALDESRGYDDIDPENCWYDWQMCRRKMGRQPELDPGARISMSKTDDEGMQQAFAQAQLSLPQFRQLIYSNTAREYHPLVKTKFTLADDNIFVWLLVVESNIEGFLAELFELPPALAGYEIGDTFKITNGAVVDWMINHNGKLHGGYTIRAHRATLDALEQEKLDRHLGVSRYL
ncbi:hypothetical protein UNDYM_5571 [Undibacterium sp. YM2]|uniref:DUF2314 domain-containing protein n=1 Tax=Undibacterium sp. YM2 TaxID=2058625 RepID=UPI001331D5B1|nr:DUF2314 domain-containing protein [Undibacterium sp. YM2]BBB69824.1 hypothetical protein UNDYM_5571 [Undibacterium sp. YM2]